MNLNDVLDEELSAASLPPVTASRPRSKPAKLASRPAWFDVLEPQAAIEAARTTAATAKPAKDEWGMFDPDQCGFSALCEKLDAAAEGK